MLLSEHVYCVAITFKMTEWAQQWICIRFCSKLEHSPWKLFQWFRRLQLWTTGDWQLHHDSAPTHASHFMQSFLVKHKITQVTQPPYSPDLVSCDSWLFQKLTSPLKGKRFQTIDEIQESRMAFGTTVWGLKLSTLKGTEVSLSYVPCFLYLVSSSIKVSIFHITWLDTFWIDLIYTMDYYSAIKKEGSPAICNNMLSGISQTEKDKYWMISLLCGIWKAKS